METFLGIVRDIVLILHFIGLGMIVGGGLHQIKEKAKNITRVMLDGAYLQVLTGIILVGLAYGLDWDVDNGKITVKFLIALAVALIAFFNRKKRTNNMWAWGLVLGLTAVNIGVAVVWG